MNGDVISVLLQHQPCVADAQGMCIYYSVDELKLHLNKKIKEEEIKEKTKYRRFIIRFLSVSECISKNNQEEGFLITLFPFDN